LYRKLQFKIVLILVSFIVCIMTVVGMILIGNIFSYYNNDFVKEQSAVFTEEFIDELENSLEYDDYPERLKNTLWAYSAHLGIDTHRNYFILDADGNYLAGSVEKEDSKITKTNNLVRAISGVSSHDQKLGDPYTDWAQVLTSKDSSRRVIVYITENNTEMKEFSWMVFSIILQSLLIGLIIAIILSFFLSKAIVSPIQNITKKATRLAKGDFEEKLEVYSEDEIGTLTHTFNKMADTLKSNLNEISNQREKLESIIHYLKDAVVAFDNEGYPMHINPEAKTLFNLTEENGITLDGMIEILDLDYRSEDLAMGENDSVVLSNVVYDNRVFDISFGKFNFYLSNEKYGGYIAVLHDVTESFELDKSRREFIATVSHELGTPLTGIKGATETIVANPDMPNDVKNHFLNMVISESDRMTHIVHDLLVLSRLDNNRMKWGASSFSITELIEKCCLVLSTQAESNGQMLSFIKNDEQLPEIIADREKTEQVLINIVQNAIKYTQNGGSIFIAADFRHISGVEGLADGKYFKVSVTDNGMGIPEEDIPHIFERFYRVEKARNSDKGGTGLGLAIAREIVQAHGGNIQIHSKLHEGTTVDIYLPQKAQF